MSGLYGDQIKALAKEGKLGVELATPTRSVTRSNPMCGDTVTVALGDASPKLEIGYSVRGCLICLASCAHMTHMVAATNSNDELAKAVAQINQMFDPVQVPTSMELFAAVAEHRSRHQCVLLPYLALADLLDCNQN